MHPSDGNRIRIFDMHLDGGGAGWQAVHCRRNRFRPRRFELESCVLTMPVVKALSPYLIVP